MISDFLSATPPINPLPPYFGHRPVSESAPTVFWGTMKKSRNRGTSTGSLHKEEDRRPYGGKGNITVERTPQDTYQLRR
jgi:hypothetical protein